MKDLECHAKSNFKNLKSKVAPRSNRQTREGDPRSLADKMHLGGILGLRFYQKQKIWQNGAY